MLRVFGCVMLAAACGPREVAARPPPVVPVSAARSTAAEPPAVCVSIGFDLRGMPHDGPRSVDPAGVASRRDWLAQRLRDATPAPTPVIVYPPTPTVFTARFVAASDRTALARCQAAVAQVVPPPRRRRGGRPDFSSPTIERACAPCPPKAPTSAPASN